jgi:hypothetical protein
MQLHTIYEDQQVADTFDYDCVIVIGLDHIPVMEESSTNQNINLLMIALFIAVIIIFGFSIAVSLSK